MVSKKTLVDVTKGHKTLKQSGSLKKLHKKKKSDSFALYIYKVLKETSENRDAKGINKKAMNIMNSMVFDVFDQISNISAQLIRYTKKRTLTNKEVETCVKLLFPVELASHAIQEGRKAVEKFNLQE